MIKLLDLRRLNTAELTAYATEYIKIAQSYNFKGDSLTKMQTAMTKFYKEYEVFKEKVGDESILDRMAKIEQYADFSYLYFRHSVELEQLKMYGKSHPYADPIMDAIYDHHYDLQRLSHREHQENLQGLIDQIEGDINLLVALNMLGMQEHFEDMQLKFERFKAMRAYRDQLDVGSTGGILISDARKRLIIWFGFFDDRVESKYYEGEDEELLGLLEEEFDELNRDHYELLIQRYKRERNENNEGDEENDEEE